jgi:HK97 family phage prohead protease
MLDRALIQKILNGVATDADLDGADRTEVLAVKGDQSEMHFRFAPGAVSVETAVRAAGEDEPGGKRKFKHVASDESRDAVGDRILVRGWELGRFQKNPQLLFAHDQRSLPIGSVVKVWQGRHDGEPALMTESIFHEGDENPQAPLIEKLVAKGALPGVSVGFVPLKMVWPESEEHREKLGLGPWGVLHEKQELLELSVVPVPANSNALRVKTVERAQPLLRLAREEGVDPELIEAVERAFNLTEEDERTLRRRMILVPDLKAAAAAVVGTLEDEAPPPAEAPDGEDKGGCDPEPEERVAVTLLRLDRDSLDAIRGLTDALTNKSTPEGGTDAESAGGDDPPAGDPPVPADPGGDFLTRAAQLAAERLGSA